MFRNDEKAKMFSNHVMPRHPNRFISKQHREHPEVVYIYDVTFIMQNRARAGVASAFLSTEHNRPISLFFQISLFT